MSGLTIPMTASFRRSGTLRFPTPSEPFPNDGIARLAGAAGTISWQAEATRTGITRWRSTSGTEVIRRFVDRLAFGPEDGLRIVRPANAGELLITPHFSGLRFIDLFAGIGGMRLGFEAAGGSCVFSSEWDRFAQQTYAANFGHRPVGDIREIATQDIPTHDILLAGFPCQPFSIAGVSKKNSLGRQHGFRDETQGTLFFDVARILADKRPAAFLLENVKNLRSHDKGRTFSVIQDTLRNELGYHIFSRVVDGQHVVPQHRERIYIVGFREDVDFEFPDNDRLAEFRLAAKMGDILARRVPEKYRLSDKLWTYLQNYAAKHRAAGNGFGFGLVGPNDTARTLSARYHKDGSEILVRSRTKNPRRLTPRECARLMGFPDSYSFPVSDTQAYRQCGNSVVVPVIEAIAHEVVRATRRFIKPHLDAHAEPPVTLDARS